MTYTQRILQVAGLAATAVGMTLSFSSVADEAPVWTLNCQTTNLTTWNFNRSDRSVSNAFQMTPSKPHHQIQVTEQGNLFKTTNPMVPDFYFGIPVPKNISGKVTKQGVRLVFYGMAFDYSAPHHYQLAMSDSHLRMITVRENLDMNYTRDKSLVSGVQVNTNRNVLHTFLCTNVSQQQWNDLLDIMKHKAQTMLQ